MSNFQKSKSPPYRRAIAYGKVAPHTSPWAGWIGSERQLKSFRIQIGFVLGSIP